MPLPRSFLRWVCLIFSHWLVGGLMLAEAAQKPRRIALTQSEQAWIQAHPVIRVAVDLKNPPWSFADEQQRTVGIDIDYINLIGERTGLKFIQLSSSGASLDIFRTKDEPAADLITDLGYVPDREAYMVYTRPYCLSAVVVVTRDDAPPSVMPEDLQHRRVATVKGYEALQFALRQSAPQSVLVEYPDEEAMLRAVARGECFAAIDDVIAASYFVRRMGLANLRLGNQLPVPEGTYMGIRRDWPMLAQIINRAIDDISDVERNAISTRWLGVDLEMGRRWARAFRIAAGTAGGVLLLLLLLYFHNRSLRRELRERTRIQNELKVAHDRLAAVSADKTKILKMVAHDLRGPLTSIMLNADCLDLPREAGGPPSHLAAEIRASARNMSRLIEELLSFHRIEAGQHAITFTAVDLAAVVEAAVTELASTTRAKRITVRVYGPESVLLESDASALGKVVGNLLSNAVKYTPPGTVVTASLECENAKVRFSVSDEGPGVKPEEREKIFDQYGRGSAQPTSGESSLGLGLWIVRMMVTDLGGKVWCEGAAGSGARFVVELPVRRGFTAPAA